MCSFFSLCKLLLSSGAGLRQGDERDRVVAQVSAEVVKPLPDRPYEGFVNLTTEISPMASAAYEAGR